MKARGQDISFRLERLCVPEPNTGCWLWFGSVTEKGYGHIKVEGKTRRAHRVSYELTNGQIPDGMELDHLCRVRCCINPDHLEPVTHLLNISRCEAHITRRSASYCLHGHFFDEKNTIRSRDGKRRCRACHRRVSARYASARRTTKAV